jgi:hypothetical protein
MHGHVRRAVALAAVAVLAGAYPAAAATIGETASNDSFATAQVLDGFFDLTFDANVFLSSTIAHVTVNGVITSSSDVDYYRFTVALAGTTGFFDIDCGYACGSDVDTTLALFDASGNLLAATDDDYPPDPGSNHGVDSFIGVYTFAAPGAYYVGVSGFANFPTGDYAFTTPLTRPDGESGGYLVGDVTGPNPFSTDSGFYADGDYVLHASLSAPEPIPEPGTLLLVASGLAALRRSRSRSK